MRKLDFFNELNLIFGLFFKMWKFWCMWINLMSEMYTLKGYLLCFDKWRTCLLWWFFKITVLILWHVQHVGKLHAVRISEVALNLGWFWSMWNLWCRYTLLKHLLEDFAQVREYLGANIEGNDFGSCLCRVFLSLCLSVSKPFQ